LDLFHWLFGNVRSKQVNSTSGAAAIVPSNNTKFTQTAPLIIGPIQIEDIRNSTLKRVSLTPAFEKGLRDEIYKYNLDLDQSFQKRSNEQPESAIGLPGNTIKKRLVRRSPSLETKYDFHDHNDDPEGPSKHLLKRQGLFLPQQQQLLLQQQAAAALQQQQQQQEQLILLQNQRLGGGGIGRYNNRLRRPYLYGDYDDDSDSDEYDEFDSDEFMSYPIRAGFIPGIPGFRGRRR